MVELDDVLTADQAAAHLGITRQRIYILTKGGKIGRRVGNTWLYTRQELDAFKELPKHKGGRPKKHVGPVPVAESV
jgi:excisionase family DNA binding protein